MSEPRRRLPRWAPVVAAVVVVAGFVALSPAPGPAPSPRNPTELLEDASFELATVRGGPWTDTAGKARVSVLERGGAYEGRRYAVLRPVTGGQLIRQDIALGARDDRSYRASAWVRAEGAAPVAGVLTAATNCAEPERTETRFRARPGTWTLVTATLSPRRGGQCSLRWEVALDPAARGGIDVDAPSFSDAGLVDSSFEATPLAGWKINNLPATTSLTVVRDGSATDGGAVGRLRAARRQGSVSQDVVLDPSSEQLVATLSVSARRAPVTQADGTVGAAASLWLLCPDAAPTNKVVGADLGAAWQRLEVRFTTPGSLIRPGGDGCTLRAELYVDADGGTIDLDGAQLALRSARPAKS